MSKTKEVKLPTLHQIGEDVEIRCENPECECVAASGTVVSVRFTKSKVFYDILDDYSSRILEDVDSSFILNKSKIS